MKSQFKRTAKKRLKNYILVMVMTGIMGGIYFTFPGTNIWQSQRATRVKVERVVDGDTLVVQYQGEEERVRFIGIDAPEIGEVGADEATEFVSKVIDSAEGYVYLVASGNNRDGFGRLRRYVYLENPEKSERMSLNEMMIDVGHAVLWE